MSDFSILRLKALLLDTITVLKFGSHLAPNSKAAKDDYKQQSTLKRHRVSLQGQQYGR
jgi:hypothetical protein